MLKAAKTENPAYAARHWSAETPYRMVVYKRTDGNGTPLYLVAGSNCGEVGAERALRTAHDLHGGECFYCKHEVPKGELTLDHVEPEASGGSAHLPNLVIAHKRCNIAKGHQPIESYSPEAGREWLTALLKQVQDRLNRL